MKVTFRVCFATKRIAGLEMEAFIMPQPTRRRHFSDTMRHQKLTTVLRRISSSRNSPSKSSPQTW